MTSSLLRTMLAITLMSCSRSGTVMAQSAPATQARFANHDACVTCHFPKPGEQGVATRSRDFVDTTPSTIWEHEDKHRRAFTLLLEQDNADLVRGMLGFELAPIVQRGELVVESLEPRQRELLKQCLHCHAARPHVEGGPVLNLDLGVSCQACHGPGQLWDEVHQFQEWRLVTPREKERLHMTDLRSPVRRAQLCASCHVGDARRQRVVTHEMYANGHPPLPGFELDTFAAAMPPHWRTLADKPNFLWWNEAPANFDERIGKWLRDNGTIFDPATQQPVTLGIGSVKPTYREANYSDLIGSHDPRQDLPHTQAAIVGGTVVLQSYVNLLADMTAAPPGSHAAWPEFTLFDCTACHHELQNGALTQDRPTRRSLPGRPPIPLWPATLARLGIVHLSGASPDVADKLASFDQRLRAIEAAITNQPFGDPRRVRTVAAEMANRLMTLATQLERSRFDEAAAKRALRFLTDPQHHELRDYHTARQLAWAIRQVAKDLPARSGAGEGERFFVAADGSDPLSLDLPAGQTKSIVRNLTASLDAIANYDPQWFSGELQRIRGLLSIE